MNCPMREDYHEHKDEVEGYISEMNEVNENLTNELSNDVNKLGQYIQYQDPNDVLFFCTNERLEKISTGLESLIVDARSLFATALSEADEKDAADYMSAYNAWLVYIAQLNAANEESA